MCCQGFNTSIAHFENLLHFPCSLQMMHSASSIDILLNKPIFHIGLSVVFILTTFSKYWSIFYKENMEILRNFLIIFTKNSFYQKLICPKLYGFRIHCSGCFDVKKAERPVKNKIIFGPSLPSPRSIAISFMANFAVKYCPPKSAKRFPKLLEKTAGAIIHHTK